LIKKTDYNNAVKNIIEIYTPVRLVGESFEHLPPPQGQSQQRFWEKPARRKRNQLTQQSKRLSYESFQDL